MAVLISAGLILLAVPLIFLGYTLESSNPNWTYISFGCVVLGIILIYCIPQKAQLTGNHSIRALKFIHHYLSDIISFFLAVLIFNEVKNRMEQNLRFSGSKTWIYILIFFVSTVLKHFFVKRVKSKLERNNPGFLP